MKRTLAWLVVCFLCAGCAPFSHVAAPLSGCLAYQPHLDNSVWYWTPGTAPRQLTTGAWPSVSSDCRWVTVMRGFPTQAWLVAADGSEETQIFTGAPVIYGTVWSPDSRQVLLTNGADAKHMPSNDLWSVQAPAAAAVQLAASGEAGTPYPSPNGQWIAFAATHWSPQIEVGLMRADGTGRRLLFQDLLDQRLEWALDSSGFFLAFWRLTDPNSELRELWWVPVQGDPAPLGTVHSYGAVQWSPRGRHLIYRAGADSEQTVLHVADPDGAHDRAVPRSQGFEAWGLGVQMPNGSADGRYWLVRDAQGGMYVLDFERLGAPRRLAQDLVYGWLDASTYLAGRRGTEAEDLLRCDLAGRCKLLVTVPGTVDRVAYGAGR